MPQPEIEEQEEPLDPAMERIRRKMVLLMLVSGGILFLCFMAVIIAVVYKVSQRPQAVSVATDEGLSVPAGTPLTATAQLPAGFEVRSVSLSGNRVLFYGTASGGSKILIFDLATQRMVADVTVAIPQ